MAAAGIRLPEINFVVLAGRLVRDGEFAATSGGTSRCLMRGAINRRVKDAKTGEWKDDTFYIDVVAWRELAERAKDKAKKGVAFTVEGRLSGREYEDKNTGQKRQAFEVVANRIQFLSAVGEAGGSSSASSSKPAADSESIEEVPF
jgi:single-strand DNA-binding protein